MPRKVATAKDLTFATALEPDSLANLITNMGIELCANSAPTYREGIAHAIASLQFDHVHLYMGAAHGGWPGWDSNLPLAAKEFAEGLKLAVRARRSADLSPTSPTTTRSTLLFSRTTPSGAIPGTNLTMPLRFLRISRRRVCRCTSLLSTRVVSIFQVPVRNGVSALNQPSRGRSPFRQRIVTNSPTGANGAMSTPRNSARHYHQDQQYRCRRASFGSSLAVRVTVNAAWKALREPASGLTSMRKCLLRTLIRPSSAGIRTLPRSISVPFLENMDFSWHNDASRGEPRQ
ncbi:hypothetical protein VTK56DRAFT_4304 [Thermocarpiscus australiensis]